MLLMTWSHEVLPLEDETELRNKRASELQVFVAEDMASGVLPLDTREWVNPAAVHGIAMVMPFVRTRIHRAPSALAVATKRAQRHMRGTGIFVRIRHIPRHCRAHLGGSAAHVQL